MRIFTPQIKKNIVTTAVTEIFEMTNNVRSPNRDTNLVDFPDQRGLDTRLDR